ncbi:hypothetical protein Tco_0708864 [Tanacetum coccineum]
MEVTDQAKEIKHLKAQIKKLKKKAKPVITHHKAWIKSLSMKQRLAGKKSLKKQWMQKESVSKQGRKPAKAEPTVYKDPAFDELDNDTMDYMDIEDAQDVGRTSYVVHEEKESTEKGVSTKDPLSTAQPKIDPKDKGKKMIEEEDESDTGSEDITEAGVVHQSDDNFIAIGSDEDEKKLKEQYMALELIRFVKMQLQELELEVQIEMEGSLEYQNVLELAILEQTATGKGIPNPLMAGSLPKTIRPTELDVAVLLKRQVADEDG